MVVFYLHNLLEQSAARGVGGGVDIVVGGAEEIRYVCAEAEVFKRSSAHAEVNLVDSAGTLMRHRAVFDLVAESVAYRGIRKQSGTYAEIACYGELEGKIVETAAEVARASGFVLTVVFCQVDTHVEEKREGVGGSVRRGVHHVDLSSGIHGVAHAAHLALGRGGVVAEYAVAEFRVGACLLRRSSESRAGYNGGCDK